MTTPRARLAYATTSAVLSIVLSCGFAVYYVTQQNKQWCVTLGILTENNPRTQIPPITESGKQARVYQIRTYDSLLELQRRYHCEVLK